VKQKMNEVLNYIVHFYLASNFKLNYNLELFWKLKQIEINQLKLPQIKIAFEMLIGFIADCKSAWMFKNYNLINKVAKLEMQLNKAYYLSFASFLLQISVN
jgi:hypothetical protein